MHYAPFYYRGRFESPNMEIEEVWVNPYLQQALERCVPNTVMYYILESYINGEVDDTAYEVLLSHDMEKTEKGEAWLCLGSLSDDEESLYYLIECLKASYDFAYEASRLIALYYLRMERMGNWVLYFFIY